MKKILTSALLLGSMIGFGQSSMVLMDDMKMNVSSTIIDVNMTTNSAHTQELLVTNTSSSAKSYKVRRSILAVDPSDLTQFCWGGLCYGYTTNVSSMTLTVNPGDTVDFVGNGFHAIMNTDGVVMTRTVHYQFYDVANANDSVGVTIRYNVVAGIAENTKADGTISNAFPNPANSLVTVKYAMNAYSEKGQIVFYDMLGKKVKDIELTEKEGQAKINVSDLNQGVYFYSFLIDGKAITTKKLVISGK